MDINAIGEEGQLDGVFVNFVEDGNVLAQMWQDVVFFGLTQQLRLFQKQEEIIQNVNDGIPVVVNLVQQPCGLHLASRLQRLHIARQLPVRNV